MLVAVAFFRRPSKSGKLKTIQQRIVQFLVKKHELLLNKELHSLPAGHTVEHILPGKGAWAHWSADGVLVDVGPDCSFRPCRTACTLCNAHWHRLAVLCTL